MGIYVGENLVGLKSHLDGDSKPEQSKTLTLGELAPTTVRPDSGKVLSAVPVALDTSVIKAENIKQDVRMLGITGTHKGGDISYKNSHADGYIPKGTGADSKTFSISITGTRGKRHKLYGAHALSTSTSSTVHTPVISDALTDVTNGVTITTEGDTVTYTWEWTVAITRMSSASKYYKTSTLLILMEE